MPNGSAEFKSATETSISSGTRSGLRQRVIAALVRIGPWCALFGALLAIMAGLGHRVDIWTFGTGFTILKWAAYVAAAGLVISIAGAYLARPGRNRPGFLLTLLGILISLSVIAVPAYWIYAAGRVPAIHDITTDTRDPPRFVEVLSLRKEAANSAEYGGIEVAIQQQQAYPDIQTLLLTSSPADTLERAGRVAKELGWQVVASVPAEGRIEATSTSFWFGFKDDVVIRVSPMDQGSRLDIRSASREGKSDIGVNAKRVRKFLMLMKEPSA